MARRGALVTYRRAFEQGKLGQAHDVVADEVLHLAADELQARADKARRRALWWVLVLAAELIAGLAVGYVWGVALIGWAGSTVVLVTTGGAITAMSHRDALRDAARALRPAEPRVS